MTKSTGFRETMRCEQAPDVYGGVNCDEHLPRWVGSADGDKDGDGPIGGIISFDAKTFPPGTRISVHEPTCPECGSVPALMDMPGQSGRWECDCQFDWHAFAEDQYS